MELYSKRQKNELLRSQLEIERSTFISAWKDLGDYILPRRPRFQITDVNRGDRRNQKIIDSTATLSARTLRSGMMSGITSPARPWFRLTMDDPDLAEQYDIKDWLHIVSQRMVAVFLKSNLYQVLPVVYGDLGIFGTAPMMIEEDLENGIRCTSFPIGSYLISKDYRGVVNVFIREFRMTVRQLIEQFAERDHKTGEVKSWNNFSGAVRSAYENKLFEQWVDVVHIIQPNEDYNPRSALSKHKKFSSSYYERGNMSNSSATTDQRDDLFLRESGYDSFPVLCPRWEVTGEDVYGTECPGMTAIGDIKALQVMHKRLAEAIEKMVRPPMIAPTSLREAKASILPGDITYADTRDGQQGFRPAYQVNPQVQELERYIQGIQNRIQKCFFEDLFLMMANSDRRQITATEIDERKEEKLLALGPVLEQLNQDLLDPLIDITFQIMQKQGLIPPPPQTIQGMPVKVEYVSIMAQAQKLVGISGIERFSQYVQGLGAVHPQAFDKFNFDKAIDVYADQTGVPGSLVNTDDQVAQVRQQQAQAQQQQAQMQAIQQGAGAAKDLSQTDTSGDNALTALMRNAQAGQTVPTGGQQ